MCYTQGGIIDLYHDVDVLQVTRTSKSLPRVTLIVHGLSNIKGNIILAQYIVQYT